MIIQECCFSVSNNKQKACWLLTNQCNLNCSYCAVDTAHTWDITPNNRRSVDAKRVASICKENSIDKVVLSGGEPLLVPDIVKTVEVLASMGIKVSLSTNGILLLPSMLRKLKSAGLVKVVIGLHWETKTKNRHNAAQFYELRKVAWNVQNADIPHEYGVVLVPSITSVEKELSSIIGISSPLSIKLIEPQYCGRMRNIENFESHKTKNDMMIIAERLTEAFAPFETVLVRPLCSGECPSGKQVFGISSNLNLERCPWKGYLDNSFSVETFYTNEPLSKLVRNNDKRTIGGLAVHGAIHEY